MDSEMYSIRTFHIRMPGHLFIKLNRRWTLQQDMSPYTNECTKGVQKFILEWLSKRPDPVQTLFQELKHARNCCSVTEFKQVCMGNRPKSFQTNLNNQKTNEKINKKIERKCLVELVATLRGHTSC